MEIRDYALDLLQAERLADKLRAPPLRLTDAHPGPALRLAGPARPAGLRREPGRRVKVPPVSGMADPAQRARILHAMANHELQAAELFAWALLAFPGAPRAFRRGCLAILAEEQRHCRLYIERLEALGSRFGAEPVTAHFWAKAAAIRSPLDFVCTMGLTFENANLDFALEHAEAARAAGDEATASVIEQVQRDEVRHVRFAWRWFQRWIPPAADPWQAYCERVAPPHGPGRARGARFDAASRLAAGLPPAFVERLAETVPTRPGGTRR